MMKISVKRGDIFNASIDPTVVLGQDRTQPVLVVQNDKSNQHNSTIVIVPITCYLSKKPLYTHVSIPKHFGMIENSHALVEQIRTIDRSCLYDYIGRIDNNVQEEIDTISVGILTLSNLCHKHFESTRLKMK